MNTQSLNLITKRVRIIIALSLYFTKAFSYDFEVDGLCYNILTTNQVEITFSSGNSYSGNIVIPEKVVHDGKEYNVMTIGESAFSNCGRLTSITIPNSVTNIQYRAFYQCGGLTSITIPNSVTTIGSFVFYRCTGLTSITVPNSVKAIGTYAFSSCRGLTSITIPSSLTIIESNVFYDCIGLTSITIPNSVTSIGNYAFSGCRGLTSITIPNSVTSIEFGAFDRCSSLTSITLPNSVTSIEGGAFSYCSSLNSITLPNSVTRIRDGAFRDCSSLTSITLPNSLTIIEDRAFSGCSGLTSITIPHSVKAIGAQAFENCSGLNSITIPNSVTIIGGGAFFACSGLTSITIPNSVTSIGEDTFSGCSGLVSIKLPNSLTIIEARAFSGCSGLSSITIPNTVTTIGESAFSACSGLISITIPNSVTSISHFAFIDCKNLTLVNSYIEEPYNIDIVFENISSSAKLQVPKGTKGKYQSLSGWSDYFKEIVEFGDFSSYTLSISVFGNGSASYGGTTIRGKTCSFIVDEKTSAAITFTPDNGHRIKTVKVNGKIVPVSNNLCIISGISNDTTIEVEFEDMLNGFVAGDINYDVVSEAAKTVVVAAGSYGKMLEVPATVCYQNTEWMVTGIDNGALAENVDLAAIIWHPEATFTEEVSNPNLLLYVNEVEYAPSSIRNVVVDGTANSITLTDADVGNGFYCPQEFTAKSIGYTHNYGMTSGVGEARGWETIVLPFDVQRIKHQSKGEIVPFAKWRSGDSHKHFWLMELTNSGWAEASSIRANTPYIISMPNNSVYKDEFRLNGTITFSATNVTVAKSDDLKEPSYNNSVFVPNYSNLVSGSGVYALNVNNDYEQNSSGSVEGSKFILNLRNIHPFEAYMTTTASTRSIDISDGMTTDIKDIPSLIDERRGIKVYNLRGQLMKVDTDVTIRTIRQSLPVGVYIVNGKKLVIK